MKSANRLASALLALAYQFLSPCPTQGKTIYLNFSDGTEVLTRAEEDDAASNQSSLCDANPYLPWLGAEDCGTLENCRNEILAQVRAFFMDFDIEFVTTRPETEFEMVVIGPSSGTCEFGSQGIARIDCRDDVDRNVAFAFDCAGSTSVCAQVIAHELGHALGLGHSSDQSDIMYGSALEESHVAFRDRLLPVSPAPGCEKSTQNSYAYLMNLLGPAKATTSTDDPSRWNSGATSCSARTSPRRGSWGVDGAYLLAVASGLFLCRIERRVSKATTVAGAT